MESAGSSHRYTMLAVAFFRQVTVLNAVKSFQRGSGELVEGNSYSCSLEFYSKELWLHLAPFDLVFLTNFVIPFLPWCLGIFNVTYT